MNEPLFLQINIVDVTPEHWQKLYRFLEKTDAHLNLSINEQLISLNNSLHILDESGHPLQLDITLADIKLQALISNSNNIKILFEPAELESITKRKVIMRLIATLSRRLKKNIFVTPAGREHMVLFSYSLETGWLINITPEELKSPYYKVSCYIDDIKQHLSKLIK